MPVGTLSIGRSGAVNAALLAARVIALEDGKVRAAVEDYIQSQTSDVLANPDPSG
ncbi:MAG TPA: hypothetical protein VG408_00855 [Actinomycetota bacterium]|nr:hypothetical protein [Actinomycetota bacterium]